MKIYDGHHKLLAEFKPVADHINLHDQKNDKIQYTICHKPDVPYLSYYLLQEKLLVAEVTPSTTTDLHIVNINVPKYGNNIEVYFPQNKTDFIAKRNGKVVSTFEMTSETMGYLDIAKGERRNFSFAFMTLFVIWCDEVAQASKEGETKPARSKSKSKNTSSRSGRSEEKSKEKEKEKANVSKKYKANSPSDADISEKSEHSEESEHSDESENTENSDSSSHNDTKRKKRTSLSKTPHVISARTSIPLRSASALKSPRGNSTVISPSNRKTESSNSVLNALLKKIRCDPLNRKYLKMILNVYLLEEARVVVFI